MKFQKATKKQAKLRMALIGPSGSGKTYTALTVATALPGPIAVIDTEHGSASKYADLFSFDTLELTDFHPQHYIDAIRAAEAAGFGTLVIDSLTHAWAGKGGALEMVDNAAKRNNGNSFAGWRDVTPLHNALVDAIVGCKLHVIFTLRVKMEYVQEKNDRGKTVIRKVGLAPIMRDGIEYEADIVCDMDIDHHLIVTKTRCPAVAGLVVQKPTAELGKKLLTWLSDGVAAPDADQLAKGKTLQSATLTKQFLKDLAAATTPAEVETVGTHIKVARDSLTPDDQTKLRSEYKATKDRIAAANESEAAPEREPGDDSNVEASEVAVAQ